MPFYVSRRSLRRIHAPAVHTAADVRGVVRHKHQTLDPQMRERRLQGLPQLRSSISACFSIGRLRGVVSSPHTRMDDQVHIYQVQGLHRVLDAAAAALSIAVVALAASPCREIPPIGARLRASLGIAVAADRRMCVDKQPR